MAITKKQRRQSSPVDGEERDAVVTAALYLAPRYKDKKTGEWQLLSNVKFDEVKRLLGSKRTAASLRGIFQQWLLKNKEKWEDMKLEALADWKAYFAQWIEREERLKSLAGQQKFPIVKGPRSSARVSSKPDESEGKAEKSEGKIKPVGVHVGSSAGHAPTALFPKRSQSADNAQSGGSRAGSGGGGQAPPPPQRSGGVPPVSGDAAITLQPKPDPEQGVSSLLASAGMAPPAQVHYHGTTNNFNGPMTINVKVDPGELAKLFDQLQPSSMNLG